MAHRASSTSTTRARLDRSLAQLLRRFPDAAEFTSEVLSLLAALEAETQRAATSRGTVRGYRIEDRAGGLLVEVRDVSHTIHCPRDVYIATAKVLADAPPPGITSEALKNEIVLRLGGAPG